LAGNWRASVAVPMLHDGKVVGAISIGKAETGPFSQRQIQLLTICRSSRHRHREHAASQ
jgi:putative methionine-R-sulfoxide reductase with GAF domain